MPVRGWSTKQATDKSQMLEKDPAYASSTTCMCGNSSTAIRKFNWIECLYDSGWCNGIIISGCQKLNFGVASCKYDKNYCNGSANNQNIFLLHSCTNFLWNVFFKKPVWSQNSYHPLLTLSQHQQAFYPQLTRAAGCVPFSQACGTFSARSALFPVGTTDNLHADNRPAGTPADNTADAAAGVGRAPCGRWPWGYPAGDSPWGCPAGRSPCWSRGWRTTAGLPLWAGVPGLVGMALSMSVELWRLWHR